MRFLAVLDINGALGVLGSHHHGLSRVVERATVDDEVARYCQHYTGRAVTQFCEFGAVLAQDCCGCTRPTSRRTKHLEDRFTEEVLPRRDSGWKSRSAAGAEYKKTKEHLRANSEVAESRGKGHGLGKPGMAAFTGLLQALSERGSAVGAANAAGVAKP